MAYGYIGNAIELQSDFCFAQGRNDVFTCTTGETVGLSALCDGTAECSNGKDETSPLCESELSSYNS